jgi:hypothetical protein
MFLTTTHRDSSRPGHGSISIWPVPDILFQRTGRDDSTVPCFVEILAANDDVPNRLVGYPRSLAAVSDAAVIRPDSPVERGEFAEETLEEC